MQLTQRAPLGDRENSRTTCGRGGHASNVLLLLTPRSPIYLPILPRPSYVYAHSSTAARGLIHYDTLHARTHARSLALITSLLAVAASAGHSFFFHRFCYDRLSSFLTAHQHVIQCHKVGSNKIKSELTRTKRKCKTKAIQRVTVA